MLEEYRLIHRFRVAFADVDMLQHVNNVAYMRWAEHIRTEYFTDVLGEHIGGTRGMILAKAAIVYENTIAYRESVAVGCRIGRIGTKSFDFAHEVWSDERELRCATISTTLVAINYETNTTIAVPADWRARIAAYERTAP